MLARVLCGMEIPIEQCELLHPKAPVVALVSELADCTGWIVLRRAILPEKFWAQCERPPVAMDTHNPKGLAIRIREKPYEVCAFWEKGDWKTVSYCRGEQKAFVRLHVRAETVD